MNFTLSKGDIKIVVAYGALALHTLQNSANAEDKIKDLKLDGFMNEIEAVCKTRPITTALDFSQKFKEKKV